MKAGLAGFAALLMATVSQAVYSETPHEETTEEISFYDDNCLYCVNDGNLFCTDELPGNKGKCYAASCEEDTLQGDERKEARANSQCTLRAHSCDKDHVITAFSQCKAPAEDEGNCPDDIVITKEIIDGGAARVVPITVGSFKSCSFNVSLASGVDKKGSFGIDEW